MRGLPKSGADKKTIRDMILEVIIYYWYSQGEYLASYRLVAQFYFPVKKWYKFHGFVLLFYIFEGGNFIYG